MRTDRVIVLKFGGSVLRDEVSMRIAVHEIYRWRRDGWRVVAVVSALNGRTNDLIAQATQFGDRASPLALAPFLTLGEQESAALLTLYLDRAGIPATFLTPAAARFIARGDATNASPRSIDVERLQVALQRDGVLVFPGFTATDEHGRTVTLGRGGSDLTALFLAHAFGAERCRLIKDVDGLYECDPAKNPAARRFRNASFDDALATDGSILQREAVRFAQEHAVSFEVGEINGVRATVVGPLDSEFDESPRFNSRPLRVALLGVGVVGGGVLELLRGRNDVELVAAAVRDVSRKRDVPIDRRFLMTDVVGVAGAGVDLVIEAIGGTETAFLAVRAALESGADVVTANKALMAAYGRELNDLAAANGRRLLCSAAVGGVTPILETIHSNQHRRVRRLTGILNGSCNFILERLNEGASLKDAVREAQQLGFAEADPTRDLSGADAIDKLHVIAHAVGVSHMTIDCCDDLRDFGCTICGQATGRLFRQMSRLDIDARGEAVASVSIEEVAKTSQLASARAEWNVAEIQFDDHEKTFIRGKGAGRWPTAEAVAGDVFEIMRFRNVEGVRTRQPEVLMSKRTDSLLAV